MKRAYRIPLESGSFEDILGEDVTSACKAWASKFPDRWAVPKGNSIKIVVAATGEEVRVTHDFRCLWAEDQAAR